MKNRRDFIRNTLFGLMASVLPKVLMPPEVDLMDEMQKANLKMQHFLLRKKPPGHYIAFLDGRYMTSNEDEINFLENSPMCKK